MGYEQINFLSEEDKKTYEKQEADTTVKKINEEMDEKEKDPYKFNCEVCGDTGCSECGFGRDL